MISTSIESRLTSIIFFLLYYSFLGTFLALMRFVFDKKISYTRVTSRFSLETLLQQKLQVKRRGRKYGHIVSTSFS